MYLRHFSARASAAAGAAVASSSGLIPTAAATATKATIWTATTQQQHQRRMHGALLQQRRAMSGGQQQPPSVPTTSPAPLPDLDVPVDMPPPPRPPSYVAPADRPVTDESLSFLPEGSPLQLQHAAAMAGRLAADGVRLTDGQGMAPQHTDVERLERVFADPDAARVRSTSVHAGKTLLSQQQQQHNSGGGSSSSGPAAVGAGEYYGAQQQRRQLSRLHVLRDSARPDGAMLPDGGSTSSSSGGGGSVGSNYQQQQQQRDTMFSAQHEFSRLEEIDGGGGVPLAPPPIFKPKPEASITDAAGSGNNSNGGGGEEPPARVPLVKQIERDIKKLEYYHGTPQYPELLRQFRDKYGRDGQSPPSSPSGEGEGEGEEQHKYTAGDVSVGLANQPIDFHRSSAKLQAQLSSGPYGYSPVTLMQQHGVMRFQGYVFPPTTELGTLKGVDDLRALQDAHRSRGLVTGAVKSFNALIGRKDRSEDYLATEDRIKTDNHILFKTLKLDAVQRRQMRFMLTDFDYKDRNTAFHVMMSYPYTDWIHVLFMVVMGWSLYQLQVRFGAYEFYDEYLGLDLRQVPSVKKPFLAGLTCVIMLFFLFQPLLVASIATQRAYRIMMRRPIGPP